MDISSLCKCIVPITQFNKGKASQNFARATKGESLLIIKNNAPVAVVLSLEEYNLLRSFSKICKKHVDTGSTINEEELKSLLKKLETLDKGDD